MNQYVKSQQMMEAHRSAALAYGKMHRMISNELAMRRDQRSNASEFLKGVRAEQDRLENLSPMILPSIISKFNKVFATRDIEKPEIAGDLDQTAVNTDAAKAKSRRSPLGGGSPLGQTIKMIKSASESFFGGGAKVAPQDETDVEAALGLVSTGRVESEDHIRLPPIRAEPPQGLSIKVKREPKEQKEQRR
jgi:hypothetical protein